MGKKFVCFCEDLTEEDVLEAIRVGYDDIESLKRYAGFSTGPCQGKTCMLQVLRLLATEKTPETLRPTPDHPKATARPSSARCLSGERGKVKVVVIGAGILGLSIAYNLAKRGADVTVLEKQYPGSGLSVRAIGAVHSQWKNEPDIRLAKKNRELMNQLSAELNFNIPFRRDGHLMVATRKEQLGELESNAKLQRSLGVDTNVLTPEEIESHYPFLDVSSIVGGTFSKGDGPVHPFSVVYGFWNGLEKHKGKLTKPTAVTALHAKDHRICSAETSNGPVEADTYVVAAGTGSREILRSVGLDVPTELVKQEMLATEPLRFFLGPMIQEYPEGISFTQSLRGEIVCELPTTGRKFARITRPHWNSLRRLRLNSSALCPRCGMSKCLDLGRGLVETTRDSEPVVGRCGYDNLWVAFADSGKAVMFAPVIGELMAEQIMSGQTNPDLETYSPARLLPKLDVHRPTKIS